MLRTFRSLGVIAVGLAALALTGCQNSPLGLEPPPATSLAAPASRAFDTTGWTLAWSDEFNGSSLNTAIWTPETGGGGWGNAELQYYRAENATVGGGLLTITAKRENYGGYAFTSARLKTQDKYSFTYGKVAARIKMPKGYGMWPAFWMLGQNIGNVGWPSCGEIDMAEMAGGQGSTGDNTVYGTLHWNANGHAMYGKTYNLGTPLGNDFHVYEAEWDTAKVIIRIDGIEYYRIDTTPSSLDAFRKPFFLLLNVAVGGNFFSPAITDPNVVGATPQTMQVDWVRVYKAGTGGATTIPATIQAESYSAMSGVITEGCSEGGQNVGAIDSGDWMVYPINVPAAGQYRISYRVASIYSGKSLSADLNAGTTQLGSVSVPNTGNWQSWTTVTQTVTLPAGTANFGVNGGSGGFNLNWIKFESVSSGPGPNLVGNAGFEAEGATQAPSAWSTWVPSGEVDADFTETYNGAHSGSYHLTHYRASAYKIWTYQIKTGLANGNYTLKAWTRSSGGQNQVYLQAKNFGGNAMTATIPASSGWVQVSIANIPVSNGQCEIGVYSDGKAYNAVHIDDFEFFKQ